MKRKQKKSIPELHELEAELRREQYRWRYQSFLKSAVYALVAVAAVAVLVATLK